MGKPKRTVETVNYNEDSDPSQDDDFDDPPETGGQLESGLNPQLELG